MFLTRRSFMLSGGAFLFQVGGIKEKLIIRSDTPADFETPAALLDTAWLTPNDLHYVRSHLPTPRIDANTWKLRIDGEVERALSLTMDDLRRFAQSSQTVTLECSGNGRVFHDPPVPGLQWEKGAVGTARWTGVRLSDVLRQAGVKPTGRHLVNDGADAAFASVPDFVRSIPIDKATHPDTILAYQMNGEPIPIHHGFPLRLIVPGWEAAASTKWLTHIVVAENEFDGNFMRNAYRIPNRPVAPGAAVDPADMIAYTELDVKSIFTSPLDGAAGRIGNSIELRGFAWAGEADVSRVDLSMDLGRTWQAARLDPDRAKYAWRRFRFDWTPPSRGSYLAMSRATDTRGRTQPVTPAWNPSGYLWNVIDKVRIDVQA